MKRRDVIGGALAGTILSAAQTSAQTPPSSDPLVANTGIARRFMLEVLNGRSTEHIKEIISPEYTSPISSEQAGVDALTGRLNALQQSIQTTYSDYLFQEDAVLAKSTVVVFRGRFIGATSAGELQSLVTVIWFDFKGGLIVSIYGGIANQNIG
jgi:hypothetical protein